MMNWEDISIEKYYKIRNILSVTDEYTALNLIDCIYGVDSGDILISEIGKYNIDFLSKSIEERDFNKKMVLNGRKYDVDCRLTEVKAAQFIDFNNHMKGDKTKYEDVLSVFIFPEGHKYNDGYDLEEVKKDILSMSIVDAVSMSKFFFLQFKLFAEIFRLYLKDSLKKMNKKEKDSKMEKLIEHLEKIDLDSLGYFHI